MDLPTVKASVKAWEKAFKAQHKRDPTKEDIKRDSSGIGEHPGVTVTDTSRAILAI
jgi:thiamine biosynthesis lipoprotein ApbE